MISAAARASNLRNREIARSSVLFRSLDGLVLITITCSVRINTYAAVVKIHMAVMMINGARYPQSGQMRNGGTETAWDAVARIVHGTDTDTPVAFIYCWR